MFVDYLRDDARASPFNLAVVRVLLGVYVVWRVASIDPRALIEWPVSRYPAYEVFVPPAGFEWVLVVEWWLLLGVAVAFAVGYRTRLSAYLTGLLLAHLAAVMMRLNHSGETQEMSIAALFVLLFGLYAEQDRISVDTLRETRAASLEELDDRLTDPTRGPYRMTALRYALLAVAIIYAGSAWVKISEAGLFAWTAPESLARWITYFHYLLRSDHAVGELLVSSQLLLHLSTWGTILTESALLVFLLVGAPITPVLLALIGMHTVIYLGMGILFFDMMVFLAGFLAFDRGYARLASSREIDVVYDEQCAFCVRSLYLLTLLDVNETVRCHPRGDAPEGLPGGDVVDRDGKIYAAVEDEVYAGYWAFRELFRQFGITFPIAWLMGLNPIAPLGEDIYHHVAERREPLFRPRFRR